MTTIARRYTPTAEMTIMTERRSRFAWYVGAVIPALDMRYIELGPFWTQWGARRRMRKTLDFHGIA